MPLPYNLQVNYNRLDDILRPHFKIELMPLIVGVEFRYVPGVNKQ
jgi:hypothetical protein